MVDREEPKVLVERELVFSKVFLAAIPPVAAGVPLQGGHDVCRTTGLTPNQAWNKALQENRSGLRPPLPDSLRDLHLALHAQRRLNSDHTIDFLGRAWPVSPTRSKNVTIVHHPHREFYVLAHRPDPKPPTLWPTILATHSLQ